MTMPIAVLLWVAALAALLYVAWFRKAPVAGLALCYWLNLAALHLPTEVLSWVHEDRSEYRAASEVGFPLTGWAMIGFLAGNLALAPLLYRRLPAPRAAAPARPPSGVPLAQVSIVVGMAVFLVGNVFHIPSVSSVTVAGNMLAAGGFAWWWWARPTRRGPLPWLVLAGSLLVPLLILVSTGFLSFGVFSLCTLAAFVVAHFRPRRAVLIASPLLLYLGLSACVTYLNGRDDIRRSIWYEREETPERVRVVETVFSQGWQWFNPTDDRQREHLEIRFNQNYFVGLAALRLERGTMDYAYGETVTNAALALVPRILWPGKPVFVGGSELMSRFTGLEFAPTVTFGLGNVLEAYVNFGVPGLLVCFAVLGAAIGVFDRRAGLHLRAGRAEGFLLWFVPGQALLNGGVGSFAEITGGLAGAVVLTWLVVGLLRAAPAPAPLPDPVGRRPTP